MSGTHTTNHDEQTWRGTPRPRDAARRGTRRSIFLALLAVWPAAGASPAGQSGNFPPRIDLPSGFFPEGIESGPGTSFFVGSMTDGAIWRGDFRTGSGTVLAAGAPGRASAGIAYEAGRDRIWVAGVGPPLNGSGDVRVYDASSGALLATYQPPGVGLLNDVAVTGEAVYVTDSAFPQLVVIPLPKDGSLPPAAAAAILPVVGDYVQTAGFNLNGIVAEDGVLLVAQSSTGKLFQVDPATGVADELDLGGANLNYPDGLELLGHTLYVVHPVRQPGHGDLARSATGQRRRPRRPCRPDLGHPLDRDRGRGPAVGGQPAVHDAPRADHRLLDHTAATPTVNAGERGERSDEHG